MATICSRIIQDTVTASSFEHINPNHSRQGGGISSATFLNTRHMIAATHHIVLHTLLVFSISLQYPLADRSENGDLDSYGTGCSRIQWSHGGAPETGNRTLYRTCMTTVYLAFESNVKEKPAHPTVPIVTTITVCCWPTTWS